MVRKLGSNETDDARQWSPYRKSVSSLAVVTLADPVIIVDDADRGENAEDDNWDPAMKVEYLTTVEETDLADELILETRRTTVQ